MLRQMIRVAAFGAAVFLSGGVATAQTGMRVDVPFSFGTPTAQMPAGEYVVSALPGNQAVPIYRLTHLVSGKVNMVVAPAMVTREPAAEGLPAQVRFRCIGEYCALSEIYRRAEYGGYGLHLKAKPAHPDVAAGHTVVIAAR